jgi:hypothetical protein
MQTDIGDDGLDEMRLSEQEFVIRELRLSHTKVVLDVALVFL